MPRTPTPKISSPTLPLENGDQLTQVEFHRRYEAYPEDVKFELIGGIVYMASPLKQPHGTCSPELNLVLTFYKAYTPGTQVAENMTVILGEESEPQPDVLLRLHEDAGGQSRYNANDYLVGAPELVVEVAHSSRAIDMNSKRLDYLGAGVQEYLVYCIEEEELHWFHFPSRRKLKPDRNGLWKSRVFPGLWINGPALVVGDSIRLMETVRQGLATPEHAAFVRQLADRRGR